MHCLTYETKVLTENGYKQIGDMVKDNDVGLRVYSVTDDGKFILKPVKEVHYSGLCDNLRELKFDNGHSVRCTHNHRFLTSDGIYKISDDIKVGDYLVGHNIEDIDVNNGELIIKHTRPNVKVISNDKLDYSELVYELTIDEETPCFILGCGVVSHNTIPTGSEIKNIYTSRYKGGVIMAPDYCLSGDTKIKLVDEFSKDIKDLVGVDEFYVFSYDEKVDKIVVGRGHDCRPVVCPDKMLKLTLNTGDIIKCTFEHQFYVKDVGFVKAKDLKVNDNLKSLKSKKWISSIDIIDGEQTYCFEVDEYHNFYIDNYILSHNSQMEVRAIAATSHEDSMLEAFRNNADIHRMNACFRGDTKLLVIDPFDHNRTLVKTLEELSSDPYYATHDFRVWSYSTKLDKIVVGTAHSPRPTVTAAKRVKVTLANGDEYYCTYDHKWLNGNGYWLEISELKNSYVKLSDGSETKVVDVEFLKDYFPVFDLTVNQYECFIVVDKLDKTMRAFDSRELKRRHIIQIGPVVHNSQVWRKPPEEITDAERRFSKMVTFAILYGANAQNIANNFMGGDLKQAEDMLDKFYSAFPKLKTWIDSMHHLWKETGLVTTLTNRIIKIPIPDKSDPKYKYKYSQKLRQSQNFPIQGSSSDIAGVALFSVSEDINKHKLLSKCFSFVHDALYLDVYPYELFRIISDVHKSMNEYPRKTYDMPVKADIVIGYSMGEELELDIDKFHIITDTDDYMEGSMELEGFRDEFDKLIDNWRSVYDEVTYDIVEEGEKYIKRGELFVPKKALSSKYGSTRKTITAVITIKSKKYTNGKVLEM